MKSKERPWVLTKEGPIHEAKNQHQGPMYVQISSKKTIKNLAKSSERIGSGYPEIAKGSGSLGRAAQLKWD